MIYRRENARFSSPVELRARFFNGSALFDPIIEKVEIWKGGDGTANGGLLVDVILPPNIQKEVVGIYKVQWDPYQEGASPFASPGVQGPGSPAQPTTAPNVAITANTYYWDKWFYKQTAGSPEFTSFGLWFYLYPDTCFVDSDSTKYRFECKIDRKLIVKGEKLDIRAQIIPIPLYKSKRDPTVDYIMPISQFFFKVVNDTGEEAIALTETTFTGKEAIIPTTAIAALPVGAYYLICELRLPNGQVIRYQRQSFNVLL